MYRILFLFKRETFYFSEHISPNVQKIIHSNILYNVSNLLVSVFLSAFVWRITGSLVSVAIYKLGEFIFLPLAFYINGLLLRKMHIQNTYMIGAITGGLSAAALVFFGSADNIMIFLYGCFFGLGHGLYWSNRNYLEFRETSNSMRQYFFSILSSISTLSKIVVPFLAGWFIVVGEFLGWYSPLHAYWALFILSLFLLVACALVVKKTSFESPTLAIISRLGIAPLWNKRRVLQMTQGMMDGLAFLSGVLVLYLLGNEGILGTITSIVSVFVVFSTYFYGRFMKEKYRPLNLLISGGIFFVSALLLALSSSLAVVYILLSGTAIIFFSLAFEPIVLGLAEEEMGSETNSRYSFIVDNEVFLNMGRILGTGIILSFTIFGSLNAGLFYAPVFEALVMLLLLFISFRLKPGFSEALKEDE